MIASFIVYLAELCCCLGIRRPKPFWVSVGRSLLGIRRKKLIFPYFTVRPRFHSLFHPVSYHLY